MRYIFGGTTDFLKGSPMPNQPDTILAAMSIILNIGCSLFSGIIIGYTALSGVMNSAHEGNVMGRAYNSMWVPLRTTLAIALLLPMSSGFSVMQVGVMWFAGKGVGLADSTWATAIDHMKTTCTLYPPQTIVKGEVVATEILKRAACVEIIIGPQATSWPEGR
ncbi:MAG: DotA/TraY family protein [Candidatus Thiodiazotropha sp.]|nr:DotA/TraY family protein [Candidatus Thiodiazotropha sp.]